MINNYLTIRIRSYKLNHVINSNFLKMLELLKELETKIKSLDKDIDKLKIDIDKLRISSKGLKDLTIK